MGVFTTWYRALRTALTQPLAAADEAYREADIALEGAGMPGLRLGLLPLARLGLHLSHGVAPEEAEADWGPYENWVRPWLLVGAGDTEAARAALRDIAPPPRDLMFEALWCVVGRAATAVGDHGTMRRALRELQSAASELAGAQSGLITFGPVSRYLRELSDGLGAHP